ncbi:MAG: alpha/beta hydrolase fold domain-containing protein, partial [Lautropia sp.]|nr:alpha/beta hydrolase fold domain-containing protein [Lautropia sp.]
MASARSTRLSSSAPTAPAGPERVEQAIPLADGRIMPARIYGRRVAGGPTPLVLHFHGGAFVGGSLDTGVLLAELLARAGSIVVSLAYPLAPEHPFPQAAEDGHAALAWLHRNRRRLGGEGAVVLVAGEEAGGNLAAAVCLM